MIFFRLLRESFIFSMQAIRVNKLRTFLTLLGITIGIFAIISVFTVLDWMENSIRTSISSLGNDIIYVQKWPWVFNPDVKWWEIMRWPVPSLEEYQKLKRRSKCAEGMCFMVSANANISYHSNTAKDIAFVSATKDFEDIRSFDIEKGRFFSDFEDQSGKNGVVLGHDIAKSLFDNMDPIGKRVTIMRKKLIVIGVFKKEGAGGIGDQGLDKVAFVPINFGRNVVNLRSESLNPIIMIKAKPGVSLLELKDEITGILRSIRRLKPSAPDNFSINQASMLSQGMKSIFSMVNLAGWIIGSFSILVGGFGIANIMFVSVKERTRIIGIQKSLGAKNSFILQQFLYESVILSLMGGILGLLIIYFGTLIINHSQDLTITLTLKNIILGLSISGAIGVLSGYTPAFRASRLNPVEAMASTF
ncbi:MAG TPA: ABC transporter permease [Bacteroidetes bacterium]|nr:ABC transporter permease [Bacteroidota bacterium]